MRYATIDEVISVAQTVVKTADSYDRNIWRQWIYLALLDLGISDDEIKVCTLYPNRLSAKLPDDCRNIIEIALYDANGGRIPHRFTSGKNRIFKPVGHDTVSSVVATPATGLVYVSNDTKNIYLSSNADNVAAILLRYFAYPVDDNNQPMVRDEDIMACVYFIRYMQALREDDNRSKIEQDRVAWAFEADRAKARKKMSSITPDKARSLMNGLMSLVTPFRQIQNY